MVVRTTTAGYQQSSEANRERMIKIPWSRQADATPTVHDPVQVTGVLAGAQMTGTSITLDAVRETSMLNVDAGAVFRHNVRTVSGYDGGNAENAWTALNIGDPVYYDPTADANTAGVCKLSVSPLQGDAATSNPRFGTIGMLQYEDKDDFEKAAGAAGNSHLCAVIQAGIVES